MERERDAGRMRGDEREELPSRRDGHFRFYCRSILKHIAHGLSLDIARLEGGKSRFFLFIEATARKREQQSY